MEDNFSMDQGGVRWGGFGMIQVYYMYCTLYFYYYYINSTLDLWHQILEVGDPWYFHIISVTHILFFCNKYK